MTSKERTEAQKIAARLNGAKSRGPVTPEGKARVGQNAVKHGLHAKRVVMINENPEAWDRFLDALNEEWQPETVTELELIHDIAAARWRLYRSLDYETALMNLEVEKSQHAFQEFCPDGDTRTLNAVCWQALNKDGTLPSVHRQEVRLRRIIKDATKELREIRERREKQPKQPPQELQKAKVQNKPEPAPAPAPVPEANVQNKPGHPSPNHEAEPRNSDSHRSKGSERIPPGSKAA